MDGLRGRAYCCLAWSFLCLPVQPVAAQATNLAAVSATVASRTVRGQVVNALDGVPVPRVLVMLNSRSQLSDAQGRFEFREFSDAQAYVTLTRPGYSQSNDLSLGGSGRQRIADLDAVTQVKIYPDALIAGVVTGREGAPLTGVPVTLRRATYDQNGLRWMSNRSVQTDLHGEYRFREPAGRFQVSAGFIPRLQDTGEAVLPRSYPEANASGDSSYFEVTSGQERRIDLRLRTGPEYTVSVQLDSPEAQRGIQFSAITAGGDSFQVPPSGPGNGSVYQISLPAGSYTLRGRVENREISLEGSTKVTVTGPRTEPATLHLEPALSLPIELAIDPASNVTLPTSSQTQVQQNQAPDVRQLNLHLHSVDSGGLSSNQDVQIRQKEDKSYEFRVPPGHYRLGAGWGGAWFIESASYGVADLATGELAIGSGGSGIPIRVVVNNTYGTISATVKLGGSADMIWIYMIPETPSLSAINPIGVVNGSQGTTTTVSMRAAVGSYVVVALDHRIQGYPNDPDLQARFSTSARHIDVAASTTATVALEIASDKEPGR